MGTKISISDIHIDKDTFTIEDAREAARELFDLSENDFERIKNAKWYQKLLRAVTFGAGDRSQMLVDIRSLSKLQQVFMLASLKLYENTDETLNTIIADNRKQSSTIEKLYWECVAKIQPQDRIDSLEKYDKDVLMLFLYQYHSMNHHEDDFATYRNNIGLALGVDAPSSEFEATQLKRVSNQSIFYRCALELCVIDFGKDGLHTLEMPENISAALGYLDISEMRKGELEDILLRDIENRGVGYLFDRYKKQDDFDLSDLEVKEVSSKNSNSLSQAKSQSQSDAPQEDVSLADLIRKEIKSGAIGTAWVLPTDEKKKLEYLAKRFGQNPPVEKTIIGVTKAASGELIFTTAALYWWRKGGKNTSKIPYKKVSDETVGIRTTGAGKVVRSIFTFKPSTDCKIEIDDSSIAADHLISLLLQISKCDGIADTDRLIAFNDLDESLQIGYYNILCGAIKYLGYEFHEAFRFVSDAERVSCWEEISAADSTDIFEQIALWKSRLPYPSEEALCLQLASDIIKVIQYTKGADDLSSKERQVISRLYEGSDIDAIINYAQLEKRMIERRVDAKTASAIMDAFVVAAGASGISALTFAGANALFWSTLWFNFLPGIGTILFAGVTGGAAISNAITSKRKEALEEQEQHRRLTQAVLESYRKAQKAAYKDEQVVKKLAANAYVISNKSGIKDDRPDLKDWQMTQIEDAIVEFLTKQEVSASSFTKIGSKLSPKTKKAILKAFSFATSSVNESAEDILGLYDTSLNLGEKYSGILFLKDRLFFRKGAKGALSQMRYKDILRVEDGFTKVTIFGASNTFIKITGLTYTVPEIVDLFKRIEKIVVQS